MLEGAEVPDSVRAYLFRFPWQAIDRGHAERAASIQRRSARRLGEYDAWQAALADGMDAVILRHDAALRRLGSGDEDYRAR
ncbi:MAG: PIN domain-containing protein [Rhodospirillaceae bacterium]